MVEERLVSRVRKDKDRDITHLGNHNGSWSPRKSSDIINDIKNNKYEYKVLNGGKIYVVEGESKDYLRSEPDSSTDNNLDSLPDNL